MHGYYPFEITVQSVPQRRELIIFTTAADPNSEELAESIEAHCEDKSPPDQIRIVAPKYLDAAIRNAAGTGKFANRVRAVTRFHSGPSVSCHFFDWSGFVEDLPSLAFVQRVGMTSIFVHGNALLQTPKSHHYEKPSGKHSTQFLRVGNAMISGVEIDFVAFCCLSQLDREIKHYYCDTGAIAPIAFSLNLLRRQLDPSIGNATIDSFGSFEGAAKFEFRNMEQSMILVSASTSGGLAKDLDEKYGLPLSRILTIFQLSSEVVTGKVVCNLARDKRENPSGIVPFQSFDAKNCELCRENSTLIRIAGDQFLTGESTIEEVFLKAEDAKHAQDFLKSSIGREFVRANYSEEGTPATSEVFFDLEHLLGSENMLGMELFQNQLDWIVDHSVPASTRRILTLDDPSSQVLGRYIHRRLQFSPDTVPLVTISEVKENLDENILTNGATVVVASAIASGLNLLSVSQILRKLQPNELVTYIIGLSRLPRPDELQRIRTNVTYGNDGRKYGFHSVMQIALPLYGHKNKTSWAIERELLTEIVRECEDKIATQVFENRIEEIRLAGSRSHRGMSESLFWTSVVGKPLALRPNFAFFEFPQPAVVSQADVYFTVLCVLHYLRGRTDSDRSLQQHEHVRRVLSPRNFERFNDGVIQSAILRAALPSELDFSISHSLSQDMLQILGSVFDSANADTGEASVEFLMALATRKLRLDKAALATLVEQHSAQDGIPAAKELWKVVKSHCA